MIIYIWCMLYVQVFMCVSVSMSIWPHSENQQQLFPRDLLRINDSLSYSDPKFCHKRSSNTLAAPEFTYCSVWCEGYLVSAAPMPCPAVRVREPPVSIGQVHSREQGHQRPAEVTAWGRLHYRKVAFNLNGALLSFGRLLYTIVDSKNYALFLVLRTCFTVHL